MEDPNVAIERPEEQALLQDIDSQNGDNREPQIEVEEEYHEHGIDIDEQDMDVNTDECDRPPSDRVYSEFTVRKHLYLKDSNCKCDQRCEFDCAFQITTAFSMMTETEK